MSASHLYRTRLIELISEIGRTQEDAMRRASLAVADALEADRLVYLLGSGHSIITAYEVHNRAGGLAPMNIIFDPGFGRAERVAGYARTLFEKYEPEPGSILFVISNSGRNALPVEMALLGRERSMTVIAITALNHSRAVTSRHPSGKRLYEVADIVIDNCGVSGDACIAVKGVPGKMGATSSVAGVAIINSIMLDAAEELAARGHTPPVFISANLDGSDEHNKKLYNQYRGRISWL